MAESVEVGVDPVEDAAVASAVSQRQRTLDQFPATCLRHILFHLGFIDRACVAVTCRRLRPSASLSAFGETCLVFHGGFVNCNILETAIRVDGSWRRTRAPLRSLNHFYGKSRLFTVSGHLWLVRPRLDEHEVARNFEVDKYDVRRDRWTTLGCARLPRGRRQSGWHTSGGFTLTSHPGRREESH